MTPQEDVILRKVIREEIDENLGIFGGAVKNGILKDKFVLDSIEITNENGNACLIGKMPRWFGKDDEIKLYSNGVGVNTDSQASDKNFKWNSVIARKASIAKNVLVGLGLGAATGLGVGLGGKALKTAITSRVGSAALGNGVNTTSTPFWKNLLAFKGAESMLNNTSGNMNEGAGLVGAAIGGTIGGVTGLIRALRKKKGDIIYRKDGTFISKDGTINGRWDSVSGVNSSDNLALINKEIVQEPTFISPQKKKRENGQSITIDNGGKENIIQTKTSSENNSPVINKKEDSKAVRYYKGRFDKIPDAITKQTVFNSEVRVKYLMGKITKDEYNELLAYAGLTTNDGKTFGRIKKSGVRGNGGKEKRMTGREINTANGVKNHAQTKKEARVDKQITALNKKEERHDSNIAKKAEKRAAKNAKREEISRAREEKHDERIARKKDRISKRKSLNETKIDFWLFYNRMNEV